MIIAEEMEEAVRRQIPLGRFATAEEVADVVVWMLSPLVPWMTGTILTLDGGWTLPTSLLGTLPAPVRRRHSDASDSASDAPADPP